MKRRLAAAMSACLAAGVLAAPQAVVELRAQAQVAGPNVTLGEVAILRSPDLDLMRMLVDLPLGRAPAAGQGALLHRDVLAGWIRRRTGVAGAQIAWHGPTETRVMSESRAVTGEMLAAAAEPVLREWLQLQGFRGEVQPHLLPRDMEASAGPLQLKARPPGQAQVRERMLVWVEVWTGERFVRSVPVAFRVAAGRDLPLHAEPAGANPSPIAAADAAPAPAGTPAVLRGQWATLRSGAGAVAIEARVEVLQDGRVGQSVRVRQSGAAAGVIATVVGAGQLELAR